MSNLTQIVGLSDDQRLNAQDAAKAIVIRSIGKEPDKKQFEGSMMSRYPSWVTGWIAVFMLLAFLGAAVPSVFRLFVAGRDYFMFGQLQAVGANQDGIQFANEVQNEQVKPKVFEKEAVQGALVGASTFILAEFLVILSTVAANVLFTGRTRYFFVVPIVMGLGMALVGNLTVVKPDDLFSHLEAVIPVFAVLFIAIVGERLMLHSIQSRHEATRQFEAAKREYQQATRDPEQHPKYKQAYANALKKELMVANAKGAGATARRELMANLSGDEWRELVDRELAQDDWYAQPTPITDHAREVVIVPKVPFGSNPPTRVDPESILMMPVPTVSVNGNGTHVTN